MDKYFHVTNTRLSKFLYLLGFDKCSEYKNEKESWLFKESEELKESLDFFFYMRKKIRLSQQERLKCQENIKQ